MLPLWSFAIVAALGIDPPTAGTAVKPWTDTTHKSSKRVQTVVDVDVVLETVEAAATVILDVVKAIVVW